MLADSVFPANLPVVYPLEMSASDDEWQSRLQSEFETLQSRAYQVDCQPDAPCPSGGLGMPGRGAPWSRDRPVLQRAFRGMALRFVMVAACRHRWWLNLRRFVLKAGLVFLRIYVRFSSGR